MEIQLFQETIHSRPKAENMTTSAFQPDHAAVVDICVDDIVQMGEVSNYLTPANR